MKYLAAIWLCEVIALAFAFGAFGPIPAPFGLPDSLTSFAIFGHMAAGLSCMAIAAADLFRAIRES